MMLVSAVTRTGWFALRDRSRRAASNRKARELCLFLLVGGSSAVAYTALNILFTVTFGLRPSLAIVATLAVLIPPTYLAQRRFTFRSARHHLSAFPRYVGTQLIGNGLALLAAELFPGAIHSQPLLAFSIIAVVVALTNYGCLKFWAFRAGE